MPLADLARDPGHPRNERSLGIVVPDPPHQHLEHVLRRIVERPRRDAEPPQPLPDEALAARRFFEDVVVAVVPLLLGAGRVAEAKVASHSASEEDGRQPESVRWKQLSQLPHVRRGRPVRGPPRRLHGLSPGSRGPDGDVVGGCDIAVTEVPIIGGVRGDVDIICPPETLDMFGVGGQEFYIDGVHFAD